MQIELREGMRIPRWYGVAYMQYDRLVAIVYPIPFNLIVRGWRWFWQRYVMYFERGEFDRRLMSARSNGWHEGYKVGRTNGELWMRQKFQEALDEMRRSNASKE